VLKDTIGYCIM